jgi:hypothetical protein
LKLLLAVCAVTAAYGQTEGILTWDEYARLRTFPRTLRIGSSRGELLYYGARHTRDPQDPQLTEIERLWREFRPTVALTEGGVRPACGSAVEAVTKFGEPGFVRWLADRDRVPIRSIEAQKQEELQAMLSLFPPDRLKLFYFLRSVVDDRRNPPDAERELQYWSQAPGFEGPPHSLEDVARLMPNWRDVSGAWFDPLRNAQFTNEVTRVLSRYRDTRMVKTLVEAVENGEHAFAVAGLTHLAMQERALRAALPNHAEQRIDDDRAHSDRNRDLPSNVH